MKLSKTDVEVITRMLADSVAENLMPAILNSCFQVTKHFVKSSPHPHPKEKAEFHFSVEIPMEAVYQVIDKITEFHNGKKLNRIHRQEQRKGPKDYR